MKGIINFGRMGLRSSPRMNYDPIAALGADLLAYWDATRPETMTIGGGNVVSSWRDLIANYNVAQASAPSMPVYNPTVFGGEPAVVFDGIDDYLRMIPSPLPTGPNPWSVYCCLSQDDPSSGTARRVVASGNGNSDSRHVGSRLSSSKRTIFGLYGNGSAPVINDVSNHYVGRIFAGTVFTGTGGTVLANDATAALPAGTDASITTRLSFGSTSENSPGGFWLGSVAAILITRPLSSDKATTLQRWLMKRRNI